MCGASGNWEAMLLQPSTQICAQQTRVFACGPVIRFGVSASPHSNQEHMHFFQLSGEEMAISWQQMEVQFVARFNPFTQLDQTRRSKNRPPRRLGLIFVPTFRVTQLFSWSS